MINALIVDDESTNTQLVSNLLNMFCPEVNVLGTAESVSDGYHQIRELKPDLVFLDVHLGDGTGFDLLECFEKIDFEVIFISAHLQYAIDAFKISAIDYILKPVSPASMINAVKKAKKVINFEELNERVKKLLSEIALNSPEKKILLKTFKRIYKVKVGDIAFWGAGKVLAIFFGRTPMSLGADPVAAGGDRERPPRSC